VTKSEPQNSRVATWNTNGYQVEVQADVRHELVEIALPLLDDRDVVV